MAEFPDIDDLLRGAGLAKHDGRLSEALRLRAAAEPLLDARPDLGDRQALNLNMMAYLAVKTGALDEAERCARKCLNCHLRAVRDHANDEHLATYHMMLASVLAMRGKCHEAVGHGDLALVIFAKNHGATDDFVVARQRQVACMRRGSSGPYLD